MAKQNQKPVEEQVPEQVQEQNPVQKAPPELKEQTAQGFKGLLIRNVTGYESYFRCGLRFYSDFHQYEISPEIEQQLRADKWLVVKD